MIQIQLCSSFICSTIIFRWSIKSDRDGCLCVAMMENVVAGVVMPLNSDLFGIVTAHHQHHRYTDHRYTACHLNKYFFSLKYVAKLSNRVHKFEFQVDNNYTGRLRLDYKSFPNLLELCASHSGWIKQISSNIQRKCLRNTQLILVSQRTALNVFCF